jgi:dynein heavy chain
MTVCHLLTALLLDIDEEKKTQEVLEALFGYCVVWAFGGALPIDKSGNYRSMFHEMWTSSFNKVKIPYPKEGTVFDYFFDVETLSWVLWKTIVPEFVPSPIGTSPGMTPFNALAVSTVDSVRLTSIMDKLVRGGNAVMFVGGAGTGKTTLVKQYLAELDENMLSTEIAVNYYTDSFALQQQIEGVIDKRSGRTFGPPSTKKMIYFLDDINLCYVEEYGTQNSHELARQHMSYGSFYDRIDLGFKKDVVDCQYLAAMNPLQVLSQLTNVFRDILAPSLS